MTRRKFALNKAELTRLRRQERTYLQFLPVLQLKQEQLQVEHLNLERELASGTAELDRRRKEVEGYVGLLAEPLLVPVADLLEVANVRVAAKSVAGVRVPVLEQLEFEERSLAYFGTPMWVSGALADLRALVRHSAELQVLRRQAELVSRELRKATQKVNLFEKVLIPETQQGIKRIHIALGDEQVAAVGRGKLAKRKQLERQAALAGGGR